MSGGGDPGNAMAAASGGAQAFGYGQNVAPGAASGQPLWAQGLMGALTGSSQYGQNAPAIHKALMGMMQGHGQQPQPTGAPAPHMRMPTQPVAPIGSLMSPWAAPQSPQIASPFAAWMRASNAGPTG